jgi:hypothetical protein
MLKINKATTFLQGGLGNQLFQYAFYLNSKIYNEDNILDVGRVIYDRQHDNVSIMHFLDISEGQYIKSGNDLLPILIKDSFKGKCVRYIFRKLGIKTGLTSYYDYDANSTFEDVPRDATYYVGYFQFVESAIFSKVVIEKKLNKLYPRQLQTYSECYAGKVGLHIRRGDFVQSNDPKHDCIGLGFIKSRLNTSKNNVVVFSDDIAWCKKNLSDYSSLVFHEGVSAFDDFLALSQCSEYILSGSTFSWWAAFLFSTSETKIVYPKKQRAQFLSEASNNKIGWIYSGL